MAILSKRIMADVGRSYAGEFGLRPLFMDLSGRVADPRDELGRLTGARRRRDYALQESINLGAAYVYQPAPGLTAWVIGLEHRRIIHGGVIGGEVLTQEPGADTAEYLVEHGMARSQAQALLERLPRWPEARVGQAAEALQKTFYQISGWMPELMKENRLKALQQAQLSQAIEDRRRGGQASLYEFEKERVLLANIRAGDRSGARRILNEMLATIYLSSPQLVVLRARAVALMSCLTRAAIEDNPLMEPLIERNHAWTERLVRAKDFEGLSHMLMAALDDFMDGIYIHGSNRSNMKVRRALDYLSTHFAKKITLPSVAAEVGLSPYRLSHLVKQCTGRTVLQILDEVRIRQAQHLLEQTAKSCTEIAYEVGFGDQSYFIRHFRRLTGTTPARYRRSR